MGEKMLIEIILLILVLGYLLIAIVTGRKNNQKYKNVYVKNKTRLYLYKRILLRNWTVCLIALILMLLSNNNYLGALFDFKREFLINNTLRITIIVISIIIMAFYLFQIIRLAFNNKYRHFFWQALDKNNNGILDEVAGNMIIPRSKKEKKYYPLVAFTAGFCEEFLVRGLFFYALMYLFPAINILLVPIITGLIFGLAHNYQGLNGVIKTGIIGMLLGYIYLAYSSLLPVIVLHFCIDFMVNFIYPKEYLNVEED